ASCFPHPLLLTIPHTHTHTHTHSHTQIPYCSQSLTHSTHSLHSLTHCFLSSPPLTLPPVLPLSATLSPSLPLSLSLSPSPSPSPSLSLSLPLPLAQPLLPVSRSELLFVCMYSMYATTTTSDFQA